MVEELLVAWVRKKLAIAQNLDLIYNVKVKTEWQKQKIQNL